MSANPCIKVNPRSEQQLYDALTRSMKLFIPQGQDPTFRHAATFKGIPIITSNIVPPGKVLFITKHATAWFNISEITP